MSKLLSRQYPYWMLIPGCLIFMLFILIPTSQGIYYSFTNWTLQSAEWTGLYNYKLFFTDSLLKTIIKNTLIFAIVTTITKTFFGLLMALLINQGLRTKGFVQTVFFSPVILSNVAVGLIFVALLHPVNGFVNKTLDAIGLANLAHDWLFESNLTLYSVSAIETWKYTGFCMIIFLAGLQTIPKDFYEAAKIDGANSVDRFFKITMPLILPAFNNVFILNIIGGLRVFDIIYATTGGGPGTASQVINTWIYSEYSNNRLGTSAAGVVILSAFIALITLSTYSWLRRKEVEY